MADAKAIDVAKWFIRNDFDSPRNFYDGNMKLQKLLYFSQLIHFAQYKRALFQDEMKAYENGTVVNSVRLRYRDTHVKLIKAAINDDLSLNSFVTDTLEKVAKIFGDMSPVDLSNLNHELESWKKPYFDSKKDENGFYDTQKNTITIEDEAFKKDVDRVKVFLDSLEETGNQQSSEEINGVTFYYNPQEINLTEDLMLELEKCEFPDEAYTLTIDNNQEVIIS